jgi:signal transduction histidine kinase
MTEHYKDAAAGNLQENKSEETTSEESTRSLVADYEARLQEAAELIARVRHEINNPLAAVLGQAQLLLREELNEKARKRAETIEELAIRLRDIVGQLRQIQKPLRSAGNNEGGSG